MGAGLRRRVVGPGTGDRPGSRRVPLAGTADSHRRGRGRGGAAGRGNAGVVSRRPRRTARHAGGNRRPRDPARTRRICGRPGGPRDTGTGAAAQSRPGPVAPPRSVDRRRIAILPFDNLGGSRCECGLRGRRARYLDHPGGQDPGPLGDLAQLGPAVHRQASHDQGRGRGARGRDRSSRAASNAKGTACASRRSSSTPAPMRTCGPRPTTGARTTCSRCRPRSPRRSRNSCGST